MPPRPPKAVRKKPPVTLCEDCGGPSLGMLICDSCYQATRPFAAASAPEPIRGDRRRAGRGPDGE